MSPTQRCDEILRLIDDVLGGHIDYPARGFRLAATLPPGNGESTQELVGDLWSAGA